jgi:2-keto-4-pentenoate hydratase/2-oxohepta-3-ene-1,7-dioic acid hydratase in catechol pathway
MFRLTDINMQDLELRLTVNGSTRQQGNTSLMLFPVARLLEYVREHFPVAPGDVVLTGTPAGVSALRAGDRVEASVCCPRTGASLSTGSWHVDHAGKAP